jgi:hypothetical protein
METTTEKLTTAHIHQFFKSYESRFNNFLEGEEPDIEGTANAFTAHFTEANPLGISCNKNDKKFRKAIPKGYEFYKSIGTTSMTIISKEITLLNDLHAIVKIYWKSMYQKKTDIHPVIIEFPVHYLLQLQQKQPKIFAYITGDEQKALKEHGLI